MSGDPYVPAIPRHPPPENFGAGEIWSGVGFPDSLLGTVGDLYVDADTGELYSKSESGWALSGGGGGSSFDTCVIGGVGPPLMAVPCALSFYIQKPGPNFGFWIGDTDTGWGNLWQQGP